MPTISPPGFNAAIFYDEVAEGFPRGSFANGASRYERTYRCPWRDRDLFVPAILGFPKIVNTAHAKPFDTYITRWLPHVITTYRDPSAGNEEWLYASSISDLHGNGPTGTYDSFGEPNYQYAMVTVAYESRTYKLFDDATMTANSPAEGWQDINGNQINLPNQPLEADLRRYVTKMQKPSAEFVALTAGFTKWVTPVGKRQLVTFATARLVPSIELTYVWHEVPFIPKAINENYNGSLNATPFVDSDRNITYEPGSLLLLSSEVKPYRTAAGAFVQDITYRMKYFRPEPGRGHNFFLRYYQGISKLFYTKITDTGWNDALAIPVTDASAIPAGLTPPQIVAWRRDDPYGNYEGSAQQNIPGEPIQTFAIMDRGTARGLYPYKEFRDLFSFNHA